MADCGGCGVDVVAGAASIPPTGAAGGDLSGFYPNPTVVGLQGTPISAAAPADNDILQFDLGAGEWVPTSLAALGVTMQNTYDASAGASPSIAISAANGPVTVRGDAAVTDILVFEDNTGADTWRFTDAGDLIGDTGSPLLQLGDASGSPANDFVKSAGGTIELRFRQAVGVNTLNDKQLIQTGLETLEFNHFDGAVFDTLLRLTATNVVAPLGRVQSGGPTIAFNLFELAKDLAGTTQMRWISENVNRFEIFQSTAHDIRLRMIDGAGATVGDTFYRQTDADWEFPNNVTLDSANPLLTVGDGTGPGVLNVAGDSAVFNVGEGVIGTPSMRLNKGAASDGDFNYRTVFGANTTGDKLIRHDSSENLVFANFNGASFDTLLQIGTTDVELPFGDLLMNSATPIFNMGLGTGAVQLIMDTAAASAATIALQSVGVNRQLIQMIANEDLQFEAFNAGGASVGITRYRNVDADWEFPNNVDVAALLGVVGDVTLASDLILDGATGAGDLDMAGTLTLDSASPAAIFGDTTGAPLLIVFKGAASTSQMFWRISAGGAVLGDKAFAHTPSEDLEIRHHDGGSFVPLMTFSSTIVSNVAHNFDAAVTMDTTLDVVADTTLESDLILDGATGAGDLTMAGQLSVGGAVAGAGEAIRARGTSGIFLCYDVDTALTNKVGRWGIEAFDNTQIPFLTFVPLARVADNVLQIGGGTGSGQAATSIALMTAAAVNTATGTTRWTVNSGGDFIPTGAGDIGAAGTRVGAYFGATVDLTSTLDVVGDATLESNLILDGVTGNGDLTMAGTIEIDGDLNHDGVNVGFYGTAPTPQSAAYTLNAVAVPVRTLLASASATTLNNNNVLAAIIGDLQLLGLLG